MLCQVWIMSVTKTAHVQAQHLQHVHAGHAARTQARLGVQRDLNRSHTARRSGAVRSASNTFHARCSAGKGWSALSC